MTTIAESRKAIYDRFITEWGNTSIFTFENEKFIPPEDTPWVRLSVRNITGEQETLGPIGLRKYDRRGIIAMQIFVLADTGLAQADALSKTAQDIFEGISFLGVHTDNSNIKESGIDGKWLMMLVEIFFFYDETK